MKVANFSRYLTARMERNGLHLPFLNKLPFQKEYYVMTRDKRKDIKNTQEATTVIETVPFVFISDQDKRSTIGNLPLVRVKTVIQPLGTKETCQKGAEILIGYFVPARQTRQYLWNRYRINLAALSSYAGCVKVNLLTPTNKEEILKQAYGVDPFIFGNHKHCMNVYAPDEVPPDYNLKGIPIETELYYSLDNVAMITAFFDLNLIVAPPPCALGLSEPMGDETNATILYYEGSSLNPLCPPLPFSGLQGSLASKVQKLFRLIYQNNEIIKKTINLSLSYINDILEEQAKHVKNCLEGIKETRKKIRSTA